MKSKVTVILTSYNQWNFLLEAITSILNINIDFFQLIVVDDGSKQSEFNIHEVKRILSSKKSKIEKFQIFNNKKNIGCVKSLNLALKHVQTDYIYILDGDDLIPPNALHKMVDYNLIHDFDILGGLTALISTEEVPIVSYETISKRLKITGYDLFLDITNGSLPFRFSGSLIKYSALKKIGFLDETFYLYTDRPTILTFALNNLKFGIFNEISCYYREHSIGISNPQSSSSIIWLDDQILIFDYIYLKHIENLDSKWVLNTSEKLKFIKGFRSVKSNPLKVLNYFWSSRKFILKFMSWKSIVNFFFREVSS
jgi:glycosyltransferase involved in cell wall biosynthesis